MLRTILTAGVALVLLGSVTDAQQRPFAKACAADIKSICQGVQPGEGRIGSCVRSHFGDLSEPCQAALIKLAPVGKACKSDFKQLCAGIKRGGASTEACMRAHLAEVSEPCKDALSQAATGRN